MSSFLLLGISISALILSLLVCCIIMMNRTDDDGWLAGIFISGIALFVFSLIYFLPVGNSIKYRKVEKLSVVVYKSKSRVYVEYNLFNTLNTEIYSSKKDYDEINDSTKFYMVYYYDHYFSDKGNDVKIFDKLTDKLDTFIPYE